MSFDFVFMLFRWLAMKNPCIASNLGGGGGFAMMTSDVVGYHFVMDGRSRKARISTTSGRMRIC